MERRYRRDSNLLELPFEVTGAIETVAQDWVLPLPLAVVLRQEPRLWGRRNEPAAQFEVRYPPAKESDDMVQNVAKPSERPPTLSNIS